VCASGTLSAEVVLEIFTRGSALPRQARLRELVSRSELTLRLYLLLPVKDDAGAAYDLFVRDALPFESDAGLVALPGGS